MPHRLAIRRRISSPPTPLPARRRRVHQRGVRQRRVHRAADRLHDERGDVPGWVLVTIMSAGIVAVLWPFAESYLQQILQAALDLVAP